MNALEALVFVIDHAEFNDNTPTDALKTALNIVHYALSLPSFEDAVKIVEDFTENIGKNQKRLYVENPKNPRIQQAMYALWALDGLLTVLRERVEGK